MEKKHILKEFLLKILRKEDIDEDEDIFAPGSLNSLFAIQLVLFLEKKFDIAVEKEDLDLENFRSLNSISKFIDFKISQS